MLSYEATGSGGEESPDAQTPAPPAPFLTEQERAMRAIAVGLVLGGVLAVLARRS